MRKTIFTKEEQKKKHRDYARLMNFAKYKEKETYKNIIKSEEYKKIEKELNALIKEFNYQFDEIGKKIQTLPQKEITKLKIDILIPLRTKIKNKRKEKIDYMKELIKNNKRKKRKKKRKLKV